MSDKKREEEKLDDMIDDSFPASDPPSHSPPTRTTTSKDMARAHEDDAPAGRAPADGPAGHPTSDRHITETASGRMEGKKPAETKPK
jgi:hypothetical protein